MALGHRFPFLFLIASALIVSACDDNAGKGNTINDTQIGGDMSTDIALDGTSSDTGGGEDSTQNDAADTGSDAGPTCTDGILNGDETDVDCGGTCADNCPDNSGCSTNDDCTSGVCDILADPPTCTPAACDDNVKNSDETDVDCGGSCPDGCGDGAACSQASDCTSGVCNGSTNTCTAPTCDDTIQNGDETAVDCGGSCPTACPVGSGCAAGTDCTSGVCDTSADPAVCAAPACDDNAQNGDETDVDCGGSCPTACPNGSGCAAGTDCSSGVCDTNASPAECVDPACTDNTQNGQETDVDCGGPDCSGCADGDTCTQDSDCANDYCDGNNQCATPACDDNVQNGNETATDCGGPDCPGCADGDACTQDSDCTNGYCDSNNQCATPTCTDNAQNGQETATDCGGPDCPGCADGDACNQNSDCANGYCDGNNQCATPACDDNVQNGQETAADCGGPDCPTCADGDACTQDSDCTNGYCDGNNQCATPACDDSAQNGNETDTDCGGADCPGCDEGQSCSANTDCNTGYCGSGGTCVSYPNCQAITIAGLSTGDGTYTIDPDGAGGNPPISVTCDMTTGDGGWTCIDPAGAAAFGGFAVTDVLSNSQCDFNGSAPTSGPDGNGDSHCQFDVSLGFDFNAMRTSGVTITSNAGSAATDTSDLTFNDQAWGTTCPASSVGDVRFGSATSGRPVLSLGAYSGATACTAAGNFAAGTTLTWDDDLAYTPSATTLRLEMDETGSQSEGWEWTSGSLCVREDILITGRLVAGLPGTWSDGTYAASCQEYRYPTLPFHAYASLTGVGNGVYAIDPDGDGTPTEVFCDMESADGGGWTCIDPATANGGFGFTITDVLSTGACSLNGDAPASGPDAGPDSQCQFDVDLGFDFDAMRTSNITITSVAGTGDLSDLAYNDQTWGDNCGNFYGDVRFGSTADTTAALSLGAFQGGAPCVPNGNYNPSDTLAWDGDTGYTATGTTLRLEMDENGGESEGWEWTSGSLCVRDAILITGGLTTGDPGMWDDGSYANSCFEYLNPPTAPYTFGSVGSTPTDGVYAIDPDGDGTPTEVNCDMTNGGWTQIIAWNRETDGDSLADLQAQLTEEFNSMGQLDEQTGFIRWSDADSTYDALGWRTDIAFPNSGEVAVDINYLGFSMEDSSIYLFAEDAATPYNLMCWSDDLNGGAWANWDATEQSYAVQSFISGGLCGDTTVPGATFTWTGLSTYNLGTEITSVHLHSLHGDCCVNGGDSSDLFRLNVWVR